MDASQNEYAKSAMNQKPQATMRRNDQNSTGTLGMVLCGCPGDVGLRCAGGIVHGALEQQCVAEVVGIGLECRDSDLVVAIGADLLQRSIGDDAFGDAPLGLADEVVDPRHRFVDRVGADKSHHPRNFHREMCFARGDVGPAEYRERCGGRVGVPHRFDGRQLHLLVFRHRIARRIAKHYDAQRRRQPETRRHRHRTLGDVDVTAAKQVPRADRQHEHGADNIARADGVHELGLRDRIEQHVAERCDFHTHRIEVESRSDGVLHPTVGDQDPQRGKIGAYRHQPGNDEMLDGAQPVPAEEKQTDERRLEEKRHQPFDGERCAENVADVMRVISPVGAELELHRYPGRHAHREIDAEQHTPELGHALPDFAARHHVHRFHDRQHPHQTEGERNEQEVVQRSDCELEARQVDGGRINHCEGPALRVGRAAGRLSRPAFPDAATV